jgi:DNA repair protein RecN (Recombination protein N)
VLSRLSIENLALIGTVEVELGPGLNVISGETGAGKSVLVDSLALLVGERADPAAVRSGEHRAVVEGVFRLEEKSLRRRIGELTGDDVEELALRREIFRDQRNRCYVAGRLSSAAVLRELGEHLLELHGQHEHQLLLRPSVQRALLDAFGGLDADRATLEDDFRGWRVATRRLQEIHERGRVRTDRIRALRDEIDEIAAAEIDLSREAERRDEAKRLRHLEDRLALASRAAAALVEAEPGGAPGALDRLRSVRGDLHALARDEPRFAQSEERFLACLEDVEQLARELDRYLETLVRDPARLAELDARESLLLRVTRRYGTDLEGLLGREAASRTELADLERETDEAESLESEVGAMEARLLRAARELSEGRKRASRKLEAVVRRNLQELDMGRGAFEARVETGDELQPTGLDTVEFLIAPNQGEPLSPLRAIASGGELSRVILAVKAALAAVDSVPTLVFDEIDAGIGGRVARKVGERLAAIGRVRQVVAVTHLAQIAVPAARHLRVEKTLRDGRSEIVVHPLDGDERVEELSRMLGGDPESATSRRHARELLTRKLGTGSARRARSPEK